MALGKWMFLRDLFARIPSPKRFVLIPKLLPFRLD
jgi:hypothetical protein